MPRKRSFPSTRVPALAAFSALVLALIFAAPSRPAFALTDNDKTTTEQTIKNEGAADPEKDPDATEDGQLDDVKPGLPMPDSLIKKPGDATDNAVDTDDKDDQPATPAEIILDLDSLPEPVKKLRIALVEAAASGDIERLRPLMQTGPDGTQVSVGDAPDDPIEALKSLSGDKQGREVLAILLDIISTSAALVDKGTPNETYVWPYFAEKRLDTLSPPELVELYRIVTAADVDDMKEFGAYNFYRLGISPDGKWKFFVAGD